MSSTMPNSPHGILILGAGELGNAIITSLFAHQEAKNTPITVLLRPSTISSQDERKQGEIGRLREIGALLTPGDIHTNDEAELAEIFRHFDTVIGASGMFSPPGTQTKICKAVLAAGVRRYFPWQFGVNYDAIEREAGGGIFAEQKNIRAMLRTQTNTKWHIISTGMFMSFIFDPAFNIVTPDRSKVHALGGWQNRVTLTDVSDIGKVVAEIVYSRPELEEQVIFVAGDTVDYAKVARVVRAAGFEIVEEEWTLDKLRTDQREDPSDLIKKYRLVFATGTGMSWDEADTFNARKGMKMMKLEDWVARNV